jgi:hypothetical protein
VQRSFEQGGQDRITFKMKRKLVVAIALFIFFSCSKEKGNALCLKIKVIGYDYCSPATMGVQILEGPQIGEVYGNNNNVIAIYNIDQTRFSIDSILYVSVRDKNNNDNINGICLDVYRNPVFSKVIKISLSFSKQPCN